MLDVESIVASGSLLLLAAIIFSECGLLIGFFLPGDTLLFAAGFFAAQGKLPLAWLLIVLTIAAILGYYVGYRIGRRIGPRLFKKDGLFLRLEYVERAELFYEKHGGKATMLARFVPVIRTIAPISAGVAKMPRKTFWIYNIIGGVVWVAGLTMLGYKFGERVHNIDQYILPIVALATMISFSPTIYHILHDEKIRNAMVQKIRMSFRQLLKRGRL